MASADRFIPNAAGYRYLLCGPQTRAVCERVASRAADAANARAGKHGRYRHDTQVGSRRVHSRVYSERTWPAFFSERKHEVLRRLRPSL